MGNSDAYYFGCCREAGHYLFHPGMSRRWHDPEDFPLPYHTLDAGLLPPCGPEVEGVATFVHLNGWTIISFWDRSVDSREKCNSAFLHRGTRTFEEMLSLFKENFPCVVSRFKFPIIQRIPG